MMADPQREGNLPDDGLSQVGHRMWDDEPERAVVVAFDFCGDCYLAHIDFIQLACADGHLTDGDSHVGWHRPYDAVCREGDEHSFAFVGWKNG